MVGQTQFDNIFCVVDLHAITVYQPPEMLRTKIRETVGVLLACGIDPAQSLLFIQSHVTAWRYASGGSVVPGPAVVKGTVYWGSGYARGFATPSHRLYAFGLPCLKDDCKA